MVAKNGPRNPTKKIGDEYYVNPEDHPYGFVVNGTLPTDEAVGVHSLTDVPVYAWGPCQETFSGTYGNVDIFYKIASCLGLARSEPGKPPRPGTPGGGNPGSGSSSSSSSSASGKPTSTADKNTGVPTSVAACAIPTKQ